MFGGRGGHTVSSFIVCHLLPLQQGLSVNVELGWPPAGHGDAPFLSHSAGITGSI